MADSKITGLPALGAAPDDADLVEIVDDVAGTPTSKQLTIANLKLAMPIVKVGEATQGAPAANLDVEFTLDASIVALLVVLDGVELSSNDQLDMLVKQGGAWVTTGYNSVALSHSTAGSGNTDGTANGEAWKLTGDGGTWGVPANTPVNGEIRIVGNAGGSGYKSFHGSTAYEFPSGQHSHTKCGGDLDGGATGAIQGLRLAHEGGGNIDAGTIRVWGLR